MRTCTRHIIASLLALLALCISAGLFAAEPDDPAAEFSQCKGYVQLRDFPKAVTALTALLAKRPYSIPEVEIRAWLMDAHLGNEQTELGMSEYETLLKEHPDYASQLHHIVGRRYQRQARFAEAVAELNTALELNKLPKDHEDVKDIRRRLMVAYIGKNDLESAYSQLRIILKDYPADASSFVVGEWPRWKDKFTDAVAELKKAADALPKDDRNSGILRGELLYCYLNAERWDEAKAVIEALASDYPQHAADCRRIYSQWRSKPAACELAVNVCKRIAGTAPSAKDAKADELKQAMNTGDWHRAVVLCKGLLRDFPEDAVRWQLSLIHAYLDLQQYREAIPICKQIIALDPKPDVAIDVLTVFGECMGPLGRSEEASASVQEFYAKHPDRKEEELFVRARTAYYLRTDYVKSAALLEEYVSHYPASPKTLEAKRLLMFALEASKQTDKAVAVLDALIKDCPQETAELTLRKANTYLRTRRFAEALRAFAEVRELKDASDDMKANATYNSGLCYRELRRQRSAEQCMDTVTKRYPESRWARQARGQLYLWRASDSVSGE